MFSVFFSSSHICILYLFIFYTLFGSTCPQAFTAHSSLLGPGGSPWCGSQQVTSLVCSSSSLPAERHPHQLFLQQRRRRRRCRTATLSFSFLPPLEVHVAFLTDTGGPKEEDEVLPSVETCFFLFLFFDADCGEEWALTCCPSLHRCASCLERLVRCVLVLVLPAASQWPGKNRHRNENTTLPRWACAWLRPPRHSPLFLKLITFNGCCTQKFRIQTTSLESTWQCKLWEQCSNECWGAVFSLLCKLFLYWGLCYHLPKFMTLNDSFFWLLHGRNLQKAAETFQFQWCSCSCSMTFALSCLSLSFK